MGLGGNTIDLLLFLRREQLFPDAAAVAEMGAQQLSNGFLRHREGLEALRDAFGLTTSCPNLPDEVPAAHGPHVEIQPANAPEARPFWRWLGCTYTAVDIDDTPGSLPLDLNYDQVPASHRHAFDLVTNFGTTEHVANQLNAFKIIHDLTAPGGVMLHELPCQGMFNHGLVNYTPKWFWKIAQSNGYEVLHMNYYSTHERPPIAQNVVDYISRFDSQFPARAARYVAADAGLVVAMRKRHDIDFVPPIDVGNGVTTAHPELASRYWTVLQPDGQMQLEARRIRGTRSARVRDLLRGARRRLRLLRQLLMS